MPVTLLNEQVYYEHGGNPFKGLHRWYSRKPLSFSRASVLGSLLPADVTMEEFEWLLGLNRRVAGIQDKTTKLYKTPPSPERIKRVQELCEQMWGTKTPTVLDAFAGGGSIPFEAARYGLNVLASDLNPVAVVTMKAAIEYPLKFGADLQVEIDKWVKWVGDEAEKRLAPFFPSLPGEKVQNYLWAHTVKCPNCESIVPLSPNWWLSKTSNYAGKGQARRVTSDWYAVQPIPNPEAKRIDFKLVQGKKGTGITIQVNGKEFDPSDYNTISGGVGKCLNCDAVIEDEVIKAYAQSVGFGHQMYAIAYRKGEGKLEFRIPSQVDLEYYYEAEKFLENNRIRWESSKFLPTQEIPSNTHRGPDMYLYGVYQWSQLFNLRQLLVLVTYAEIINDAKHKILEEVKDEKAEAIISFLALILDRCADENCRMSHWNSARDGSEGFSAQHSLNLMWNYIEIDGVRKLWNYQGKSTISDYLSLCAYSGADSKLVEIYERNLETGTVLIDAASADSLFHIPDRSLEDVLKVSRGQI